LKLLATVSPDFGGAALGFSRGVAGTFGPAPVVVRGAELVVGALLVGSDGLPVAGAALSLVGADCDGRLGIPADGASTLLVEVGVESGLLHPTTIAIATTKRGSKYGRAIFTKTIAIILSKRNA
jgi:hypothetical protein